MSNLFGRFILVCEQFYGSLELHCFSVDTDAEANVFLEEVVKARNAEFDHGSDLTRIALNWQ